MNPEQQKEEPLIDTSDIKDTLSSGLTNTIQSIKNTVAETKNSLQQSMDDFSSQSAVDAGNEFLESNSLIAKFAFIILVLFGFMFLFRIGMLIISYILTPSTSPYLVSGMIRGDNSLTISQNSRTSNTIINYSENQQSGLEFTYSVWLTFSKPVSGSANVESHIFNKGIINGNTQVPTSNAPGLYVKSGTTNTLRVYMDTFNNSGTEITSIDQQRESLDISGVPFNKWMNVIIRAENRILDVYVNGVLTQHKDLGYVPKQNFSDVYVCQNGGFHGSLSDLRYYPKALNVFEINSIVGWGPSLSTSSSASEAKPTSDSYYLSSLWYKATQ
jgi:hypothetical protein